GDFCFPEDFRQYLGLIYNYRVNRNRADFGSIYIYGTIKKPGNFVKKYIAKLPPIEEFPGNLVAANPHRDGKASRSVYPEYYTMLSGEKAVKIGEWHRFKAEIMDGVCHFYIDDMKTPKITYGLFEQKSGKVGFKPRYAGSQCWIDNITATSISQLSWKGKHLPQPVAYKPGKLLTSWQAIGPFYYTVETIEKNGYNGGKDVSYHNRTYAWKKFETDARGCIMAGRLCEFVSG
ncbi:MAG: hypothetical protein GY757_15070, partial [bacterium]|nr:hypothetical protein [bacterium]